MGGSLFHSPMMWLTVVRQTKIGLSLIQLTGIQGYSHSFSFVSLKTYGLILNGLESGDINRVNFNWENATFLSIQTLSPLLYTLALMR